MLNEEQNVQPTSENGNSTKPNVMRTFSEEQLYGIWQFANDQRSLIIHQREQSENTTERLCLTFTANCIVDIMNEIAELLEPSDSFYCDEKHKSGYTCEDGQCERCAKLDALNCA